jgi:anhydro-N-acetylmuramic acid kinase
MSKLYIGLMSGTSVDGIDAALVDLSDNKPLLIDTHSHEIPADIKQRIEALCTPGSNEIDRLGKLDIELGQLFAAATQALLNTNNLTAKAIAAIGCHGQTIRHRPPSAAGEHGFSLQIGDPNTVAEATGITTVADFRRRDMAAAGQGAPLTPAFHLAIAPPAVNTCAFLNLGGIANLTLIHQQRLVSGFDIGPANSLLDAWIAHKKNSAYDASGAWAKSGVVHDGLLKRLTSHAYFNLSSPKSTGRETFNLEWIKQHIEQESASSPPIEDADVQATLLQLTCTTIAKACQSLPHSPEIIYCCGGGTSNTFLMEQLAKSCLPSELTTTNVLDIAPDWIEACAFAWLASQTLMRKPIAVSAATGGQHNTLLGGVYYAAKNTVAD